MNIILKKINLQNMGNSLKSYPFTIFSSLVSTIFFCLSLNSKHDYFIEGGFACLALIALFYAIETYSSSIILRILGLVIGGSFYYFYIRKQLTNHSYPDLSFVRYAIFLLLAHLLAALSGYKKYDIWAFNKSLFINIIITFLYTMTLFVGLGIALGGISALFDIKIESEVWGYIFVISNVFLSTLLFVSNPLETNEQVYPKFLKNFASYILIPLTSIYTVILLTYGFQILITKEVPKGWVSLMVFSNAILGILSFLLLYPLRKTTQWINKFTNVYFWILLPLIVLLAMAIWVRIDQYGLTFGRTMIVALGIWLLGITLYYIISKKDLIVIVPASLFVVVLWHTFGPLNGAILSNWQQKKSLEKHLSLLSKQTLNKKEIDRLNASIDFFSTEDTSVLIAHLPKEFQAEKFNINTFKENLKIPSSSPLASNSSYFSWSSSYINTKDSDFVILNAPNSGETNSPEGDVISLNLENNIYEVKFPDQKLQLNLSQVIANPKDSLISVSEGKYTVKLLLNHITFKDKSEVSYFDGHLLVKKD